MQGFMNISVRVYAAKAQSDIKRLEAQVVGLERALSRASKGSAGFVGNKHIAAMTKWGNQVQWTGRQLAFNFTVPLAMAATQAVKWQLANEKAFTQVKKVYGDTAAAADFFQKKQKGLTDEMATQKATAVFNSELEALQRNFRALSDYYGVAQDEVINVGAAWAAAGASGRELAVAVDATMKAIILGDMEAEAATKALISIQGQYSLSSGELMTVLEQLNAVENQTGISMSGLIEGFERAAGVARDAGISTRDLAAMLAALTPAAGSAANAGNALKTIISRLMSPTREANQVFKEMGINTKDLAWQSSSASDRLQIMADKFNKLDDAQKVVVGTVAASRWQINKFSVLMRELSSTTGYYQKALDATKDPQQAFNTAQRELNAVLSSNPHRLQQIWVMLQNASADIIQPLIPYILWLAKSIADFLHWVNELPVPIQKAAVALLLLVAVFGPLIKYFGAAATFIGQFGLSLAHLATGPIKLAAAGFGLLGKAFGLFVTLWGTGIKFLFSTVGAFSKIAFSMGVGFAKAFRFILLFPKFIWAAGKGMIAAWRGTLIVLQGIWTVYLASMRLGWIVMQTGMMGGFQLFKDALVGGFAALYRSWVVVLAAMRTTGILAFGTMAAGMKATLLTALNPKALLAGLAKFGSMLLGILVGPWGLAIAAVVAIIVIFRDQIAEVWGNLVEWWNDSNNSLVEALISAWNALPEGITNALVAIAKVVQKIALQVYEWLSYLNPFASHSPSLVDNVKNGLGVIKDEFAGLGSIQGDLNVAYAAIDRFGKMVAALGLDGFSQDLAQLREFTPSLVAGYIQLHSILGTLNADLEIMNGKVKAQEAVVARWEAALDKANATLDAANAKLDHLREVSQAYSDELDAAQQRLQDWADTPIQGMQIMSDKIFENEMAQKRLRLEMLRMEEAGQTFEDLQSKVSALQGQIELLRGKQAELRSAGAGSEILSVYDDQITALEKQQKAIGEQSAPIDKLQKQLDELAHQGEVLDLENSLKFDPLKRQIDAASNSIQEMPFDTIMAGMKAAKADTDRYTAALATANAQVAAQEAVVKRLELARDAVSTQLDLEKKKLDALQESYQKVEDAIRGVESAMSGMTQAASASEAAQKAAKKAKAGPKEKISPGLEAFRAAKGGNFPEMGGTGAQLRTNWEDQSGEIDKLTKELQDKTGAAFGGIDMFGPYKKKWEEFKTWVETNVFPIGDAIKEAWNAAFAGMGGEGFGSISEAFDTLWGWIQDISDKLKDTLGPAFEMILNIWDLFKPAIDDFIGSAKKGLGQFMDEMAPAIEAIKSLAGPLADLWKFLWPVIKVALGLIIGYVMYMGTIFAYIFGNVIGPIFQAIGGILSGIIRIIVGTIKVFIAIFTGDWALAWEGIKDILAGAWQVIWSILRLAGKVFWGILKGIVEGVYGFFKWLFNVLVGHSIMWDIIDGIIACWKFLISLPVWVWDHIIKPIVQYFVQFGKNLATGVKNIIDGVWKGFKLLVSLGQWVWDNVFLKIWNFLKMLWNTYVMPFIQREITGFKRIWEQLKSLAQWVWDNVFLRVWNFLKMLWNTYIMPFISREIAGFKRIWEGLKSLPKWINDNFIQPIYGGIKWLIDGIGKLFNLLQSKISGPIDTIKKWINDNLLTPLNKVLKLFGITIPLISVGTAVSTAGHGTLSAGRLAQGGPVNGRSPSSTADNIPLWGTAGEFMHPVKTVQYYGEGFMEAIRRRQIPKEAFSRRGYFLGGLIDKGMKKVDGWLSKGGTFAINQIMNPAIGLISKAFSSPEFINKAATGALKQIKAAILAFITKTESAGGGFVPGGAPGSVVNFRGKRLNQRTITMLLNAEKILGGKQFHITQGSYSTSVAASGSTHAGGGAMDTNEAGAGWLRAQTALRTAGFAAWWRHPWQGPWNDHIHSIARGDPTASPAAKAQMAAYARGGDGLGHGMYRGGLVGLQNGAIVRGGRGGVNVRVGEGKNDELVSPLPRSWKPGGGDTIININGNLEFPNVTSGEDVEDLVSALESLAGDYK